MKNIVYTAKFVLDKEKLLKMFPPKHEKVFAHHSTIAFKPANLDGIEAGKRSTMKILGRVYDEKGDALLVENPKSKNKYPHITLSCTNEVGPKYSNELIEKAVSLGAIEYFDPPIEIEVAEGWSDGQNDFTEQKTAF